MPLLNTADQEDQSDIEQEEQAEPAQEEQDESPEQEQQESDKEGGGLTITAEQIGAEVMKKANPNQRQAIQQAVNAGMKILFSKETHNKIFDSIRPEDQVPLADELGTGATNLMLLMYEHSKHTMPLDAIVPAGAILLAKACEFIDKSGMAPVTDDDYSNAFQLFAVAIQDKFDPDFRKKNGLKPKQGSDMQESAMQPDQEDTPDMGGQMAGMMQQQPSGLLNQGAMR